MNVDIARQIGAVTREVRNGTHDGKPTRVVIVARSYNTTVDDVWDAITNPERIPRWFLPVTGDLQLGGHYQLTGNAGGQITGCEPPENLALTWEFGGSISWVTVRLSPDSKGGTRLELQHASPVGGDADDFWNQFGPGAVGIGWDLALMIGLDKYLTTRESVDPSVGANWPTTDDGRMFVQLSSDAWRRASVAFGTSESGAADAAARTAGFYIGTPPAAPTD